MIAQIEGKIVGIKGNAVIVMVGGIGYRVAVSSYTLRKVA
ncbi:MAG TPA: Holliday junction branch migration protein RuvA, partial [Candidatus Moranbacteria bacterium]|nr:Holliday junction branch migration protein RuvA [Candidatus Moranbacteria bacterium]